MNKKLIAAAATASVLTLGVSGAGVAYATGADTGAETGADTGEQQATGPKIDQAKSVALDHTNGGRVTGTELGDEEGAYEVEVTRKDGSQIDVHLDQKLNVLGTKADQETPDDKDNPNDK